MEHAIAHFLLALESMAETGVDDPDCEFIEAVVAFICANGTPAQCAAARANCEEIGCDCPADPPA